MEEGTFIVENVAAIFSITLDMYLICQMVVFLNEGRRQRAVRKNLICFAWMMIIAICLRFWIPKQVYGFFYLGSITLWLIYEKKAQIFKCLLYMLGCAFIVGLTNLIITCGLSFVFYKELYFFNVPVLELAAGVICFLIYFLLLYIGGRYLGSIDTKFSNALLVFSLLMLGVNSYILMYALHFAERITDPVEKREISLVFSMVSVGMLVELVLVMLAVAGVYSYRKMIGYKDKLIEAQVTYNEDVRHKNNELRAVKHDFKSHYIVLGYLLKKERYQEAETYAKDLTDALRGVGECCNTGSFVVDALLGEKIVLAKEKGIEFTFEVRVPEQWKVTETDQCILFSNLLNNAFEAVEKVENGIREIIVETRVFADELLIRVANTYNGELDYRDGELITSKEDKDEHGFGLKNIAEIAEKYQGCLDVKKDAGMFDVMVRV